MSIQVKIITLHPDSQNTLELSEQLSAQGITYQTSQGVDGRQGMPDLTPHLRIDQAKSRSLRMIELTSAEVGCYLSHIKVIQDAYDNNKEHVCILEDDTLIEADFAATLDAIEQLPEKVEFVRLMGLKRHKRKVVDQLTTHTSLTRPHKGLCGTQGYVINRRGMRKVLEQSRIIAEPIDKFYDHFWDIDLHCYGVEPHAIWERPHNTSSIKKQSRGEATRPPLRRIQKHLIKLSRGTKRRLYIFKRYRDFHPATKPTGKLGNTDRIR